MGFRRTYGGGFAVATAAGVFCAPTVALAGGMPYPGDPGQGIAAVLIFVILLLVLRKYAWKPILGQLQHREEDYASKVSDAEEKQALADELVQEYHQKLDTIETQTQEMLVEARKDAAVEKEKIIAEARSEIKQARARADEDIDDARSLARQDIQTHTADMVSDIVKQVLRKELTDDDHSRLITEVNEQIARQPAEGKS
ncbi:MAG: F0F1 ATP synthase subunit B [Phycisphaerae bacterium]|nr:F0F1 ATP synthase subunit B [Phycisphaerae bacterium]